MKLSKFFLMPCFLLLAVSLAACKPSAGAGADKPDPNLALIKAPAVGDIYAAELTDFTAVDFTAPDGEVVRGKGYGLLKVVAVQPDKVVIITENASSDDPGVSKQDIKGDLSDITFDESEKIDVVRSQLEKAYTSGKIYEVRRGS